MAYKDYKSRTWLITSSNIEGCTEGKHVHITGPATNVTIRCGGTKRYEGGRYRGSSDTIEVNDSTISIVARNPYKIQLAPNSSKRIGGSWTAEDHTSGPVED